jgi:hypothetical protein
MGGDHTEGTNMHRKKRGFIGWGRIALTAAIAMVMLGPAASKALADEPIVGLWQATWTDASGGPGNGNVVANV